MQIIQRNENNEKLKLTLKRNKTQNIPQNTIHKKDEKYDTRTGK